MRIETAECDRINHERVCQDLEVEQISEASVRTCPRQFQLDEAVEMILYAILVDIWPQKKDQKALLGEGIIKLVVRESRLGMWKEMHSLTL